MSIKEVPIAKIKPNPFCPRAKNSEAMSKEAIGAFADEIQDLGWWGGSLKAREKNGGFELAFGSRRLAALKSLGHKTLSLDVEKISDDEMKLLMAVENFQRHAYTEEEKIKVWAVILELKKGSVAEARALLGIGAGTAAAYNKVLRYGEKKIPLGEMSARALDTADNLGGEEMVRMAAKKKMSRDVLENIQAEINRTTERKEPLREKLVEAAKKGRITSADDVKKVAKKIRMDAFDEKIKEAKKKYPPDLLKVIEGWVKDLPEIIEKLEAVAAHKTYADYIVEEDPKLAGKLKVLLKALVRVASKLEESILGRLDA